MNEIVPHRNGDQPRALAPMGPDRLFGGDEAEEGVFSFLVAYWQVAFKHRWLVAAICGGFVLVGLAYTLMSPREYSATTRIQIDRSVGNVVDFEDVKRDGLNDWEFYETQYRLLESRSLAEKVVDDLALDEDDAFLVDGDEGAIADLEELTTDERRKLAVGKVRGSTEILPIDDSSMVDILHVSRNPETAARIANAVAEGFIAQNLERRFEASAYARDFLKQRLDATRERLEESEREAAAYARSQGIVMTSGDAVGDGAQTVTASQLTRLNAQLAEATAARVQAESDFRNNNGGRAAANSLDNQTLSSLRRQRSELRAELSKLESDFGPEYPRVKALSAQIGELDVQIASERAMVEQSVASDLGDRYRQALAAERALKQRVDSAMQRLLDEQQDGIRFNILERDVATNRALYEGLLQRYKEVGVAGGIGSNNVSIVDEALVPGAPSSPNMMLNLMLALIVGMGMSAGVILLLEQLAANQVRPSEVPKKLGLPLLGSTPLLGHRDEASKSESGELAEAYFSTLTSIQFSSEEGAPKTMLVTSTQKGEGKSTSALAIARDLAALGMKVVLVDSDLRSPSVHKEFGDALGEGTSDYLTGRADLKSILRDSGEQNLAFISSGTIPPNPAKLLSGERIAQLIEELSANVDHVVIDGPPVLGLADAPLLSRHVAGTLFVIESQRTSAVRARSAVERLLAAQARLIGAIVTKFDERTGGYGYGYGYGYGSNYRYGN